MELGENGDSKTRDEWMRMRTVFMGGFTSCERAGGKLVIMQGVMAGNGDSVSSSIACLLLVLLAVDSPCSP